MSYNLATNSFTALAAGVTNVNIIYRGKSKTVFFEILEAVTPPVDPITVINDTQIDKKDQLDFKVYPNPVTNELTIELQGNTIQTNFEIINLSGQVIFKGTVFEKVVVQTENFVPGVYLVKLESENKFEYKKVIKSSR
ncbi:MAG: T9SS type A sorting domain-containing protein [Bacteroidota bacterium]|nr:T9SS type A sorting domain-containing protein [Bacteroidota bacterium]